MTPRPDVVAARARLAQILMSLVVLGAMVQIFAPAPAVSLISGGALVVYLALGWRHLNFATWVPLGLSALVFAVALWHGINFDSLLHGLDRMVFLAALLGLLGTLRTAAAQAPEVERAGKYLTDQPSARRYLALNSGGHIFGLLINFGGLAILLDIAVRSVRNTSPPLPAHIQEIKLRRMTLATIRGFAMISLWSPLGFAINALLLSLPGLDYFVLAPIGLAASLVFTGVGWAMDYVSVRQTAPPRPRTPDPGARTALIVLLGHVFALAGAVFALHLGTPLGFQQALLLVVPVYSLFWAALAARTSGAVPAMGQVVRTTIRRLPGAVGEIGIFAAAGFLSVLLVDIIPIDAIQSQLANLPLSPGMIVAGLAMALFWLACVGINPIITASVLGALVSRLQIPGLSDTAIALAFSGSWASVMGFSPFNTTVAFTGAVLGRSPAVVGLRWNGVYSLTMLVIWTLGLAGAVRLGLV